MSLDTSRTEFGSKGPVVELSSLIYLRKWPVSLTQAGWDIVRIFRWYSIQRARFSIAVPIEEMIYLQGQLTLCALILAYALPVPVPLHVIHSSSSSPAFLINHL